MNMFNCIHSLVLKMPARFFYSSITTNIIRPHRSTIVTDQVAWSVSLLVCQSDTLVSPAKTAEPIEMPFGLRIRVGAGNHIFNGVHIPMGRGNFEGGRGIPL